jgi:hypothetical protein
MTKPPDDPCEPYFTEIYTAVGRALSAWSWVEESFCVTYTTVLYEQRMPVPPVGYAQAAFWAVESFRAKLNVVDSAVRMRCRNLPDTLALWTVLHKRAGEKTGKRHALAHGTVMNFGRPEETFYIPSMAKTMLADIAAIPPGPTQALRWLAGNMFSNRLTAAEINHRTQSFQAFKIRVDQFNGHLHDELPKITPDRGVWPLSPL